MEETNAPRRTFVTRQWPLVLQVAAAMLLPLCFELTAAPILRDDPPVGLLVIFVAGFPVPLALFLASFKSRTKVFFGLGYLVAEASVLYLTYSSDDDMREAGLVWWPLLLGGALALTRAVERDGIFRSKQRRDDRT